MHEITLSQRALEIIEQQAQQAGARRVTGVWLKVGAFSCVEASALTFCFELVCRGTLAEGCETAYCRTTGRMLVRILPAVRATHLAARAALSAVPQRHAADCGGRRPTDSANRSDPPLIRVISRRPASQPAKRQREDDGTDQE